MGRRFLSRKSGVGANGVTTSCESLYVGVPVISLYGRNGVSRSGLNLLGALGLGELAASLPLPALRIAEYDSEDAAIAAARLIQQNSAVELAEFACDE